MKHFIFGTFMFISTGLFAQHSSFVIFAQEGEPFWVILNGVRQNEEAQTNIRIAELYPGGYKVKVIFQDSTIEDIDRNIMIEASTAYTSEVRAKKNTKIGKEISERGNSFAEGLGLTENDKNKPEVEKKKYVMRLVSQVSLATAPAPASSQRTIVYSTTPPPGKMRHHSTTTTTTTTTSSGHPHSGESVTMDVRVDGAGGSVQISSQSETHHSQSTTTTTTTTSDDRGHGYGYDPLPGYTGPTGCAAPMKPQDFEAAKRTIAEKDFSDTKLQIAEQVTRSNCLFADQVRDIAYLFDFEDTRLEYAKYAYDYTYDQGNYFKVNDAFEYESSVEELHEYIEGY